MYNETINYYEMIYLQADTGECINLKNIMNENSNLKDVYYTYIDSNKNSKNFNVRKSDGELVFDINMETTETNLPSSEYPFTAKIDSKEMTFKAVKTPVTGAKIIEYTYSEDSPIKDSPNYYFHLSRNFLYKTTIFALNNESNLESINKINLDINKGFEIAAPSFFNDLKKLLTDYSIIKNKMQSMYNEWKVENGCEYGRDSISEGFSIYYLSEKIIHIIHRVYDYSGGIINGMYASIHSIYSLETGNKLEIEDLITDLKNPDLLNLVKVKLLKIEDIWTDFLDNLSLEIADFYFTSKGLVFKWGIYVLGPRSIGEPEVLISAEEIKPYLKDEYKTIFE